MAAYGAEVSTAPRVTPSIWNSTPVTATSSLAVAETTTMPVRPAERSAGAASATVGAVGSAPAGGLTVTLTAVLVVAAPRESVARAVRLCAPVPVGVQPSE